MALVGAMAAALAGPAWAGEIAGDSVKIRDQAIRLEGIDVPESGQYCRQDGQAWRLRPEAGHGPGGSLRRRHGAVRLVRARSLWPYHWHLLSR